VDLAKTFEREPLPSLPKWVEISTRERRRLEIDRNDEFVRAEPEGAPSMLDSSNIDKFRGTFALDKSGQQNDNGLQSA
jgi:hypothetical protein